MAHHVIPFGRKRTVAVIDDNPEILAALERVLYGAGFDVWLFESAEDFLAAQTPVPYCLILDVDLPGISGLGLMAHLRRIGWSVPTIVATGQDDPAVRMFAEEQGCRAFFLKPVGAEELLRAIEACGS